MGVECRGKALAGNTKKKGNEPMQVKVKKAKAGLEDFRQRVKEALARKGARAYSLIKKLATDRSVVWRPEDLDAAGLELRHLAFQIRALQHAKLAAEEAESED
ncbi:MAG: hypothetical protein K6F50_06300 [Kiritimatiellae bacterium]|nr:hypothetical protein [Kiritimatiellia bacterium]